MSAQDSDDDQPIRHGVKRRHEDDEINPLYDEPLLQSPPLLDVDDAIDSMNQYNQEYSEWEVHNDPYYESFRGTPFPPSSDCVLFDPSPVDQQWDRDEYTTLENMQPEQWQQLQPATYLQQQLTQPMQPSIFYNDMEYHEPVYQGDPLFGQSDPTTSILAWDPPFEAEPDNPPIDALPVKKLKMKKTVKKEDSVKLSLVSTKKKSVIPDYQVDDRQNEMRSRERDSKRRNYSNMVELAIKSSPKGQLSVTDIYEFICERFPFFKSSKENWKNSVRHCLSTNQRFLKLEPGLKKKCYWTMNPNPTKRAKKREYRVKYCEDDVDEEEEDSDSDDDVPLAVLRTEKKGKTKIASGISVVHEKTAAPRSLDSEKFDCVFSDVLQKNVVVTVGEIRRRMGAPEKQDWKMISSLTRHPKNSHVIFKSKMLDHGFEVAELKSERSVDSAISMLIEEDAITLAKDFYKILSAELSKCTLASIAAAAAGDQGIEIAQNAVSIMKHLRWAKTYLLCAGLVPGRVAKSSENRAVYNFSLNTHGFGPLAAVAVINSLIQVMQLIAQMKENPLPLETELAPLSDMYSKSTSSTPLARNVSSGNALDRTLLHKQYDDVDPFGETILPRIAYGIYRIQITRGEIRRRVLGPEKMNADCLINFLRKNSKTHNGSTIRKELAEVGITRHTGNTEVESSSWSFLSETESMALASETGKFLATLPPSQAMREEARANPHSAAWLRYIAASIADSMNGVGKQPENPTVKTAADMHILRFAIITHHFGPTWFSSVMQWIEKSVR